MTLVLKAKMTFMLVLIVMTLVLNAKITSMLRVMTWILKVIIML